MRPALKSGLLPVWRDRDTLQIGIDPRRAIALSGMGRAAIVIGLLDGSRDREQVIAAAAGCGVPAEATERVLALLAAGGALDDFALSAVRELPRALRAKLAPEIATSSLAHGDGDGGARALARRRSCMVRIDGDRRIADDLARILTSSGVRNVLSSQDGGREPAPPGPGRDEPGRDEPDREAPRGGLDLGLGLDLVILAGRQPLDVADRLTRDGVPHLAVTAGEAIGTVGPVVLPGRSACLRCLDYTRAGNDPSWPLILAQLASRRSEPPACDAALAAAVAAFAAVQALTCIDRSPEASAAVNGTLELVLPDWRWRRRTWRQHPACICAGRAGDNRQLGS